jgi:myo-inositol 2-dehydrogenase/D-chiro-inositol 1-dehydrogenase
MCKLTVGVAGAGRIGKVHVGTLVRDLPEVRVAAIADPREEEARKVAEQHGIPSIRREFGELVHDPEIDAVLICSPTDTHAEYIIAAARAGKDIFCEKPVALSLDVIRQALEAVDQCGVRMMIGFNRRFDPNFQKVRSLVESGRLGDLHVLKITSRDPNPHPPD